MSVPYWRPMDTCPRGTEVILCGPGKRPTIGRYDGDKQWLGWYPIPIARPQD